MRGFQDRATVQQAWAWIDSQKRTPRSESIASTVAGGRVLSQSLHSQYDVPSFRRAMMDGYAVQSADIATATAESPADLEIAGLVLPGQPFAGILTPGQVVRIMTGAPFPESADVCVPVELTQSTDDDRRVQIMQSLPADKHVGTIGEDIAIGDEVLSAGRRLRPQDIGVLCSIGVPSVEVRCPVRVRIVVTGNELLPPGSEPQENRIIDSNSPLVRGLVSRDGGVVTSSEIMPDDPAKILEAMQDDVDVVVVTGGTSVGQEDYAPHLLAEHGEIAIHGISLRPGGPTGMGRMGDRLVFLLPGNPVSCLCAYELFAGRAIRELSGHASAASEHPSLPYRTARFSMAESLKSKGGRYECARVDIVDGAVVPLAIAGSSMLSSTTRAAGLMLIPADVEMVEAGEEVMVYLFD